MSAWNGWDDMKVEEFRERVKQEFGKDLRHATPANVREFLDQLQAEVFQHKLTERIILDSEPATSYEEIIKEFFARILDSPDDDAFIALWTLALDMSFAAIESQYADRFTSLFRELD